MENIYVTRVFERYSLKLITVSYKLVQPVLLIQITITN